MTSSLWPVILLAVAATAQTQAPSFERLAADAKQAYEANRLDDAVKLFAQALELNKEWAEGWWALGMIEYQRDRFPQCRDALTRLIRLDSSAGPGFALLGLCEFETKQYDSSFEHLKRAHMLVPPGKGGDLLDIADYHLGMLLVHQGAFEVSQEIFIRLAHNVKNDPKMMFASGLACLRMAVFPDQVPEKDREVVMLAGKAFWDLANRPPAEAEASFNTLVAKYPAYPNVHYFYGTHLAGRRRGNAEAEFLAELKVNPNSVPARVQLALGYILERRLDEAMRFAREAVSLSPDSVGCQLALGRVLRERGDDEGALAAFLEAKRLDPVSPEIRLYLVAAYRAVGKLAEMRREQANHDRLKAEQANWP